MCSPLPTSHMTGGRPHEKKEGVGVRVSSLEKGGALLTYVRTHMPLFAPVRDVFRCSRGGGGMFSPTPLFVPVRRVFKFREGTTVLQTNILILMLLFCPCHWPQLTPSCSAFLPLSKGFLYGDKTALSLSVQYTSLTDKPLFRRHQHGSILGNSR